MIAKAGNDVTFLARGEHLKAMQERACGDESETRISELSIKLIN
jgi:ketopantoate reductase